jgi:hypothetical protein
MVEVVQLVVGSKRKKTTQVDWNFFKNPICFGI